jgi:hypothetical protein
MAVPDVNITIEQGTDYVKTFTIKNSDNSVLDLTGYTSYAKIAKYPNATDATPFSVGIASTAGQIIISMANTITSTLDPGRHYYDVVIVSAGGTGTVTKVFTGMALVNASITV